MLANRSGVGYGMSGYGGNSSSPGQVPGQLVQQGQSGNQGLRDSQVLRCLESIQAARKWVRVPPAAEARVLKMLGQPKEQTQATVRWPAAQRRLSRAIQAVVAPGMRVRHHRCRSSLTKPLGTDCQQIHRAWDIKAETSKAGINSVEQVVLERFEPRGYRDVTPISVTMGQGWAESRMKGKSTPVVREIRIRTYANDWHIMDESDPSQVESIVSTEAGPQIAGKQLATVIKRRVDGWGMAVAGGYWKPRVTLEVYPQSEVSAQRLQRLLEGSGVEISIQQSSQLPSLRRLPQIR